MREGPLVGAEGLNGVAYGREAKQVAAARGRLVEAGTGTDLVPPVLGQGSEPVVQFGQQVVDVHGWHLVGVEKQRLGRLLEVVGDVFEDRGEGSCLGGVRSRRPRQGADLVADPVGRVDGVAQGRGCGGVRVMPSGFKSLG